MSSASTTRYLVTGATGFIGSEVLVQLLRGKNVSPDQITLLGRRTPNYERGLFADRLRKHDLTSKDLEGVEWVQTDFSQSARLTQDLELLRQRHEQATWIVIHMAALIHADGQKALQERVNLGVTHDLLHWLNSLGRGHFIFTSSVVAFGGTREPRIRSEKDFSDFPNESRAFSYYTTKRAAHLQVLNTARVGVTLLCPGIVHGPLEHYKSSRSHLKALREKRLSWAPPGGGGLVGLDKVATAIVQAAMGAIPAQPITRLLVEENWSYQDYFQLYARLCHGDQAQRIRRIPAGVGACVRRIVSLGFHSGLLEGLGQGSLYTYFQSEQALPEGLPFEESLRASLEL